jgi:hypothetical protein
MGDGPRRRAFAELTPRPQHFSSLIPTDGLLCPGDQSVSNYFTTNPAVGQELFFTAAHGSVDVDETLCDGPVPALRSGLSETLVCPVDEILDHFRSLE